MWPVLLKLGPFPVNTFGVMLVISFLVGTWYITRDAKRQGLDAEKIHNLCWYVLGAIVIGGRLMFIITEPKVYIENPLRVFYIWEGGLVYYGGFLGTVFTVIYFAWKNKMPIWKLTDLFTVGGMLGLAIGRWSCFFAGDDHGRVIPGTLKLDEAGNVLTAPSSFIHPLSGGDPTHPLNQDVFARAADIAWWDIPGKLANDIPWWAVKFPRTAGFWDSPPAMDPKWTELWLYPSQWMMSLNALFLFLILGLIAKKKKFDGQLTALLLMLYAIGRSLIELYRGDERGVYLQPAEATYAYALGQTQEIGFYLTTAQITSIVLFILGAALYLWKRNAGVAPIPAHVSGESEENGVSSEKEEARKRQPQKPRGKKARKR